MKILNSFISIIFVLILLSQISFCGFTSQETKTMDFISYMNNKQNAKAYAMFDDNVKQKLPEFQFNGIWEQIELQYGKFEKIGEIKSSVKQDLIINTINVQFTQAIITMQFSYNKDEQITSFLFMNVHQREDKIKFNNAEYIDENMFKQQDMKFGLKDWELTGTLTTPNKEGKFPLVILVHGSGPNDRDETLSSNKPFKDIAEGLSTKGIAVFRYDKRTKVHPAQCAAEKLFTVKEETIDDAVEALKFLQNLPTIDKSKIYILGHSLGGYLMPRIAKQTSNDAAGYIIMAGCTQHLEDVIIKQYKYILQLDDTLSSDDSLVLAKVEEDRQHIKSLRPSNKYDTLIYFNAPPPYWLDLKDYEPEKEITSVKQKLLILQGGRDYQVTKTDFDSWQNALKKNKNATFKFYESLNHLFITGTGKPSPTEYNTPGHVDARVIEDIYNWIMLK